MDIPEAVNSRSRMSAEVMQRIFKITNSTGSRSKNGVAAPKQLGGETSTPRCVESCEIPGFYVMDDTAARLYFNNLSTILWLLPKFCLRVYDFMLGLRPILH